MNKRVWPALIVTSLVAVTVLVILGLSGRHPQVLSLRTPTQQAIATVGPRQQACEGPVSGASAPAKVIRLWGAAVGHPTIVAVAARAGGQLLARGRATIATTPAEISIPLGRVVALNRPTTVCVLNTGSADVSLLGSPAPGSSVAMTVAGKRSAQQFSLAFLGRATSNLSDLSLIFARAALFRPSWVGAWTFWALLVGLVIAGAVGIWAVAAAARADQRDERADRSSPGL